MNLRILNKIEIEKVDGTSDYQEFLLKGKKSYIKLNLKSWKNDGLVYIYGNEKYVDYERIYPSHPYIFQQMI